MSASESKPTSKPTPAARAEAAAWIARLHGPNRTRRWRRGGAVGWRRTRSAAAAFELLTDTWEKSARLRRRPVEHVASWEQPGFRMSFSRVALATMATAVLAVVGTVFYLRGDGLATGVGEQRTLTLEDGTRVYLNTDTRIAPHYDKQERRIELERGEALFEVAKRPDWPFIVRAGDRQVRALGTAFVVRLSRAPKGQGEENDLSVTLVEGKVTVSPVSTLEDAKSRRSTSSPPSAKPPSGNLAAARVEVITLAPGQRVTFSGVESPKLDQPALERVTAWQRGQVALDNTPLAEAIAEMNRYSRVQLVIQDPRLAAIPVSGIFRAGDSEDFANAVAKTYRLQVVGQGDEILLADLQ